MQPSLPPLVRAWFPHRIGFATAVYTNGLLVGEIFPVALTIPFVLPLFGDSWRMSFVFWSLPVLLTALLVMVKRAEKRRRRQRESAASRRWWPDWRSPLIWRLGLIFGSVNAMYFVTNAFLPDYVTAAGRAGSDLERAHRAQCRPVAGVLPDARTGRTAGEAALGLCDDRRAVAF